MVAVGSSPHGDEYMPAPGMGNSPGFSIEDFVEINSYHTILLRYFERYGDHNGFALNHCKNSLIKYMEQYPGPITSDNFIAVTRYMLGRPNPLVPSKYLDRGKILERMHKIRNAKEGDALQRIADLPYHQ